MIRNFFTKKINAIIVSGILGTACDQNKLMDLAKKADITYQEEDLSSEESNEVIKNAILQSKKYDASGKLIKPILYSSSFDKSAFLAELKNKEGFESKPYFDQGNLTIGYGTSFAFRNESSEPRKILQKRTLLRKNIKDENFLKAKHLKNKKNKVLKKKYEAAKKATIKTRTELSTLENSYIGKGNAKFLAWCKKNSYVKKLALDENVFLVSGITTEQAATLLEIILDETIARINQTLSSTGVTNPISKLPSKVQETIIDLGFNIGPSWLNIFTNFKKELIVIIKEINTSGVTEENLEELNKKFKSLAEHIKSSDYGKLADRKYRVRKNIENIELGIIKEGFSIKGLFV